MKHNNDIAPWMARETHEMIAKLAASPLANSKPQMVEAFANAMKPSDHPNKHARRKARQRKIAEAAQRFAQAMCETQDTMI